MAESYHPVMKGDAYRALCVWSQKNGYRVKLEVMKGADRHIVLNRVSVWKVERGLTQSVWTELGGGQIVNGDLDHVSDYLLRWFAHEEQAA